MGISVDPQAGRVAGQVTEEPSASGVLLPRIVPDHISTFRWELAQVVAGITHIPRRDILREWRRAAVATDASLSPAEVTTYDKLYVWLIGYERAMVEIVQAYIGILDEIIEGTLTPEATLIRRQALQTQFLAQFKPYEQVEGNFRDPDRFPQSVYNAIGHYYSLFSVKS